VEAEACRGILDRVPKLRAIPAVATRLLRALEDERAGASEVAREVRNDPAVAALVLRAANSSFYRASREVKDVVAALVVIGFRPLRELLLCRLAREAHGRPDDRHRALFVHALATALAAEAGARVVRGVTIGHVFTAALFHDVGKAVLHEAHPAEAAGVEAMAATLDCDPMEIEATRFGADHAAVGAALLTEWELPPLYAAVARHHHDPAGARLGGKDLRVLHLVVAADAATNAAGLGVASPRGAQDPGLGRSLAALDAGPALVDRMTEAAAEKLSELSALFV
jgi:putative nucleotidyltransferase with HDIG domain